MRRLILCALIVLAPAIAASAGAAPSRVHRNGLQICSVIIEEMTEGRVAPQQAGVISAAIARAVHNHFGRVTCGDMWLYMAIAFVESGFRSNIINYKNCWGIFQVHGPSWAHKFGMNQRDLLDPHKNADAGVRVFKYYLERHGSMIPALSAYNSDHPSAATRYARAVLYTRFRIKQRYTKLYWSSREVENIAVYAFTL